MDIQLSYPDTHHFNAAQGWFELGNLVEANAELDLVSAASARHPEVLELRWHIVAAQDDWDSALAVARDMVLAAPDYGNGWVDRSFALHELKRTPEAWDALLPAVKKFPKIGVIPYNLACYACCMDNLDEARKWLKKAAKILGKGEVKIMALGDSDLAPLWEEIKAL